MSLEFNWNWKLGLFTLLLLPVLISLGLWQLAREQEKLDLLERIEQRLSAAPVPLEDLHPARDIDYLPVRLTGRFDNARLFLLDNRVYRGRAGFDVFSPFITEEGRAVLVNRGWAAMGPTRADVPEVVPVPGRVTLTGRVHVPRGAPLLLGEAPPFQGWPHVIESADVAAMAAALGLETNAVFPYEVRLEADSPGALTRNWTLVNVSPEKHRAYAVQWFTMAGVLVLLFLYASFKKGSR